MSPSVLGPLDPGVLPDAAGEDDGVRPGPEGGAMRQDGLGQAVAEHVERQERARLRGGQEAVLHVAGVGDAGDAWKLWEERRREKLNTSMYVYVCRLHSNIRSF